MTNTLSIKDIEDIPPNSVIVCMPWTTPLAMPDNLRAICSHCGRVIQHRPHVPAKLIKVCMDCALPIIARDAAEGDCQVTITRESADEMFEHIKKAKQ